MKDMEKGSEGGRIMTADYNGQYDAYDNIDWEAQDHSP